MRKKIIAVFLAVSLLVPQFMFISTAKEGADGAGSGDDATVSAAPAESSVTEDTVENNQEAAEEEEVTEPAPQAEQAEQIEQAESDVPVMEEGTEDAPAAYAETKESQETALQEPQAAEESVESTMAAYAEQTTNPAGEIVEEGSYTDVNGIEMFWRITADGTLTYSGSGTVENIGLAPWYWWHPEKVVLEEGVTGIGDYGIGNYTSGFSRSVKEIYIPESVIEIGVGAFKGCSGLERISLPSKITIIEADTFSDCTNLKEIGIPRGVTKIGGFAFSLCESLSEVNLPDGLEEIGSWAFRGCTKLEKINLPSKIISIESGVFDSCKSLKEIKIPKGITKIGEDAFCNCENIAQITIPSGVREIGLRAFQWCGGLQEVIFQGNAPTIIYGEILGGQPFGDVTATAYYLSDDPTWTEELRMDLGKNLNWVGYGEGGSPANIKVSSNTYNSLKITWNKAPGAQYYQVYRSTSKNGSYARIGTYAGDTTSAISRSLNCGKTFYYKVRAYAVENGKAVYSGYSSVASGKPVLPAPKGAKASANTYNTLKISWNKVSGANYYQVYRSTSPNGKYVLLGTYDSNTTSSISRSLGCGTTYYYKVRAYRWVNGQRVFSGYSSVASGKPVLPAPGAVKAERASSSTVKVSWSSVSGGQYYQVYRSTSKNGSYALLGTYDSKTASSMSRSLKRGTTYYYKVRTYRWVNGQRVFSPFSTIASATP